MDVKLRHLAQRVAGEERGAVQDLARERRGGVVREPLLDVDALVRVPIGREDRVAHELTRDRAQEILGDHAQHGAQIRSRPKLGG